MAARFGHLDSWLLQGASPDGLVDVLPIIKAPQSVLCLHWYHRAQKFVLLLVGHVVPSFQISEGDSEFLHLAIPTFEGGSSRQRLVTLVKELEQMDSFLSSGGVVGWCSAFQLWTYLDLGQDWCCVMQPRIYYVFDRGREPVHGCWGGVLETSALCSLCIRC